MLASQFCAAYEPWHLTHSSKSVIRRLNLQCTVLARRTEGRIELAPHQRMDTPGAAAGERDMEKNAI